MKKVQKFMKDVGKFATGAGVGLVVSNVVKATTPCCTGILAKGAIMVGTFVLSNMAADKATEYYDEQADTIIKEVEFDEDGHITETIVDR